MERMSYIVYWESPGSHSETISFDSLELATAEFYKIIEDGFISLPGRKTFSPVRMKVVQEKLDWVAGDKILNPH